MAEVETTRHRATWRGEEVLVDLGQAPSTMTPEKLALFSKGHPERTDWPLGDYVRVDILGPRPANTRAVRMTRSAVVPLVELTELRVEGGHD
jgi:hypothetical protein